MRIQASLDVLYIYVQFWALKFLYGRIKVPNVLTNYCQKASVLGTFSVLVYLRVHACVHEGHARPKTIHTVRITSWNVGNKDKERRKKKNRKRKGERVWQKQVLLLVFTGPPAVHWDLGNLPVFLSQFRLMRKLSLGLLFAADA